MNLLRSLIAWFLFQKSKEKFSRFIKTLKGKKLFIFDIDNTLADTWPCYHIPFPSYNERLLSLPVFIGMKNLIKQVQASREHHLFITARNNSATEATVSWLQSIGIDAETKNVIIVSTPAQKVSLIKKALSEKITIEYFDDLAYNHENGTVKIYKEALKKISDLPVIYHSKEQIDLINQQIH
jgi:FMN phosphatase YigB (HAD superfamily)